MVWPDEQSMNFQRHLITLGTVAACAFLVAWSVGAYLEASLGPEPSSRTTTSIRHRSASPRPGIDAIVQRNVFCSGCAPAVQIDNTAPSEVKPLELDHLQLIATLVSDDPGWCFAAIRDTRGGETGLYRGGSSLPAGLVVNRVEERRVELARQEQVAFLELQPEAQAAAGGPPARRGRGGALVEQLRAGIRKVGPGRYEIDRGALGRALANSTQLGRWARIAVRSDGKGRPAGFGLNWVHPDSIYALLGLNTGDAIQAINGRPLTPEVALALYPRLRSLDHVTISLVRRGKSLTQDYTIIQ